MTFGNSTNDTKQNIIDQINKFAANRPRQLQVEVGASGIGTACQRQLGYRVLNVSKLRSDSEPGWLTQIGTAVHAYLENIFSGDERYLSEQAVTIKYADFEIPGTVDLYDKATHTVIDFKIVGEATLGKARRKDISTQYQVQVALYALGLKQAGYRVDNVGILFLPRNKELSDAVLWQQPFDPKIAEAYIQRYHATRTLTANIGVKALDSMLTANAPCVWCDWFNPDAKTVAEGCTGIQLNNRNV